LQKLPRGSFCRGQKCLNRQFERKTKHDAAN
jgi:hypothetical protein